MTHFSPSESTPSEIAGKINETLQSYSDKDWNYSRILLVVTPLEKVPGPYVLCCDFIDVSTKEGKGEFKVATQEIRWGDRHSSELGILEVVSLRLNKALFETASDEIWGTVRPIIRTAKKEILLQQGISDAFWYEVEEVAGEDFENR